MAAERFAELSSHSATVTKNRAKNSTVIISLTQKTLRNLLSPSEINFLVRLSLCSLFDVLLRGLAQHSVDLYNDAVIVYYSLLLFNEISMTRVWFSGFFVVMEASIHLCYLWHCLRLLKPLTQTLSWIGSGYHVFIHGNTGIFKAQS